ncbi:hypothetical protein D5F01_LYC22537 [Larimichthys crocea]|uniref:UFSP1/2/DUB catalytic domain-containing protein n=1 Tax=Larimichthys crocea TaxID=215358 RepID=A0A6G0HID8_LARCR|nr:hypothetical protein D5F01_LYC22537 [Larimichthys crocea]
MAVMGKMTEAGDAATAPFRLWLPGFAETGFHFRANTDLHQASLKSNKPWSPWGTNQPPFSCSREWIGTFEASLVLDYFYDVPCKLVHVRGGGAELEHVAVEELHQHFEKHGSPVMMGGDRDNSSKGILGVCSGDRGSYLLVVDPHYYGCQLEQQELQKRGWVAWKRVSSLDQSSFYNLCMPQTAKKGT